MRFGQAFLLGATVLLAACGRGGEVRLDIVEITPARSAAAAPGSGGDSVPMDVHVRAGPLRFLLERGGTFDLAVVDCAAADAPYEPLPLFMGGTPVDDLYGSQISDDPEMLVLLAVAVPREAMQRPGSCARFVGRDGFLAPTIVSRPVPLPGK